MAPILLPHLLDADLLKARLRFQTRKRDDYDSYANQVSVGKPGSCPETPALTILLFDNSGSISGGRDPVGRRFTEAGIAAGVVAGKCRCGDCKLAVYHFDTPTSLDLKPTTLARHNLERINSSLALPADGAGASMLLPSLRAARQAAAAHPNHAIHLVALTDFELFDAWENDFLSFPGFLHAVVIRAEVPTEFKGKDNLAITSVDHTSTPGVVARALFHALVSTRPGAAPLPITQPNLKETSNARP